MTLPVTAPAEQLTRMQRIRNRHGGTDYRLGKFVAIREDEPSEDEYGERLKAVTWGAVPADLYDRRGGDVGLPDAVHIEGTLRDLRSWLGVSDAG